MVTKLFSVTDYSSPKRFSGVGKGNVERRLTHSADFRASYNTVFHANVLGCFKSQVRSLFTVLSLSSRGFDIDIM